MNSPEWKDLFEEYYFSLLDKKSREAFEQALESDQGLRDEYLLYKEIAESALLEKKKKVLSQDPGLKKVIEKELGNPNPILKYRKWWLFVVFVLLALFLSLIIIPNFIGSDRNNGANNSPLKESMEDPPLSPDSNMEYSDDLEEDFPKGIDFENVDENNVEPSEVVDQRVAMIRDYLELSYSYNIQTRGQKDKANEQKLNIDLSDCRNLLMQNNFRESIKCLRKNQAQIPENELKWLLSLSYLGLNQIDSSMTYLNQVADDRLNNFFPLARELRNKLKN